MHNVYPTVLYLNIFMKPIKIVIINVKFASVSLIYFYTIFTDSEHYRSQAC